MLLEVPEFPQWTAKITVPPGWERMWKSPRRSKKHTERFYRFPNRDLLEITREMKWTGPQTAEEGKPNPHIDGNGTPSTNKCKGKKEAKSPGAPEEDEEEAEQKRRINIKQHWRIDSNVQFINIYNIWIHDLPVSPTDGPQFRKCGVLPICDA